MSYEDEEFKNWAKKHNQVTDNERIIYYCAIGLGVIVLFSFLTSL